MKKKVVVIGSGLGGAAIGALLQHQGRFDVTLLEKNNLIGGRYATYEKKTDEGIFKLDVGCHLIANCNNGTMGEVLKRIGKNDSVQWSYARRPKPAFYFLGERIDFPKEVNKLGIPNEDLFNLLNLMRDVTQFTEEDLKKLDDEQVDMRTFLKRYTSDPKALSLFSFFAGMEFVIPDYLTAASEWIVCQRQMSTNKSSGYPIGGCGSVPRAYCNNIEENGGKLILQAPVKEILIENNEATGVKLEDGTVHPADIVISNAGFKHTVLDLVGKDHFSEEFTQKVESYEYSLATFQIKIALDEKITDEKMIMYIGEEIDVDSFDRQAISEMLARGEYPEEFPIVFAPIVSNMDPSLCPEGKQLIFAGAGCPTAAQGFDPKKHHEKVQNSILNGIKNVLPKIEDHLLWIDSSSPHDIEKFAGESGTVIGIAQTINQVGKNRPKQELPIKNLYCCCADTGLHGIGGELAVDSALRLYNKLI
ncbi:MAG: phytoene desaturase family protein [Candidatus Helarchaeota archaeon]